MNNREFRLAAVGTGYFSQFHYDAWHRLSVNLTGICSLKIKEARKVSSKFENCEAFTNLEEMLASKKPNLVDVIVPPKDQVLIIEHCLEHRVPIICQKPFTTSLRDATHITEKAEDLGVPIFVHENFRFQPWHIEIKRLLETGLLGEIYQCYFRMRPGDGRGPDAYLSRQPYFQKMERFVVRETIIHIIDIYRHFFGNIESVSSNLTRLNPHIKGEDAGYIMMNFKSGTRALIDFNRLSDHVAEDRRLTIGDMVIEGVRGTLRLDGNGKILFRAFETNEEKLIWNDSPTIGFAGDSVFNTQKHILEHMSHGSPIMNTARQYLENIEVEEAIYESNKEGKKILI